MTTTELYRFIQGQQVWTYTSGDTAIAHDGEIYTPIPIGRTEIEQAAEINRAAISVALPRDNPIAAMFLAYSPDAVTALTVFRKEAGMVTVAWKGRVVAAKANGSEVVLECESVFTSLRRPGLRARYQRQCRHTLYRCGVDRGDFAVRSAVDAIDGALISAPAAVTFPAGYFFGGMLESPDGVLRFIVEHQGALLTLARPIEGLAEQFAASGYGQSYGRHYGGLAVTLYPGCDRSREICATRFYNIENHGGFPWIPQKNPFDGNSIA